MRENPVIWFEIYVTDLDRARRFYESVLATTLEPLPAPDGLTPAVEMLAFPRSIEKGGAGGALVAMKGMAAGANSTIIYFACEDCATEAARVEAAGGKIVRPKTGIAPYGHIALATDPDGNMFGLHSMR